MAPDIPDRWLDYIPVGKRILGTRFIAFKVPLREHVVESVKEDLRLSCSSLLKKVPNLGMIIDLTYTKRFYDPEFFEQNGLKYKKLMIRGHEVPPKHLVVVFNTMVHEFLRENSNNSKLIGVHCTHGLNRTGYLICNYMISEMQMEPNEAIKSFNTARGHQIERQNYINSLTARSPVEKSSVGRQEYTNWRTNDRNPTSHHWRTNDRNPTSSSGNIQ